MICNLGSRVVNNYLISSDLGYILIDTGYDGSFPRFLKMLGKNGVDPKEIKFVFLTHAHDDHAGFLNEVLSATDAQVILHPKAVAGLKRALFGHGEHRYPPIRDAFLDRLIPIDSERFRSLGFPYEILETPGHTADHISLLVGDKLFCGDAAMNGFPSRRRTIIWIENLRQYQQSWDAMVQKAPAVLYPGHGKPFKTSDLRKYRGSLERIKLYPLK